MWVGSRGGCGLWSEGGARAGGGCGLMVEVICSICGRNVFLLASSIIIITGEKSFLAFFLYSGTF